MNDESLRDLERAVASDGGATARLKYARALERSGRRDEALETLLPARERSEEVRREIGRFPRARGDLSESLLEPIHVADLAPLVSAPNVAWRHELAEGMSVEFDSFTEGYTPFRALLTHPLVVVFHVDGLPVTILDLATGSTLWEHVWEDEVEPDSSELQVALSHDELLLWDGTTLVARELWSGEERWRHEPEGKWNGLARHDEWLATWAGGELTLSRCRPAGSPEELWRTTVRGGSLDRVTFAGDQVQVFAGDRLLLIDAATGEIRRTIKGRSFRVDEHGILRRGRPRELALHDLEGERLWTYSGPGGDATLLPDSVLVAPPSGPTEHTHVRILDRATGAVRATWPEFTRTPQSFARGVFHGYQYFSGRRDALRAYAADGAVLWEWEPTLGRGIRRVSPVHRGLVVLTYDGTVAKLTPGS